MFQMSPSAVSFTSAPNRSSPRVYTTLPLGGLFSCFVFQSRVYFSPFCSKHQWFYHHSALEAITPLYLGKVGTNSVASRFVIWWEEDLERLQRELWAENITHARGNL